MPSCSSGRFPGLLAFLTSVIADSRLGPADEEPNAAISGLDPLQSALGSGSIPPLEHAPSRSALLGLQGTLSMPDELDLMPALSLMFMIHPTLTGAQDREQ